MESEFARCFSQAVECQLHCSARDAQRCGNRVQGRQSGPCSIMIGHDLAYKPCKPLEDWRFLLRSGLFACFPEDFVRSRFRPSRIQFGERFDTVQLQSSLCDAKKTVALMPS